VNENGCGKKLLGWASSESCAHTPHVYIGLAAAYFPDYQHFSHLPQFFRTSVIRHLSNSLELFVMHGPWNASSERKLLLCIIGLQSKLKWKVIAQRMGGGFTDEACRYVDFFSCNAQSTRVRININWWTPQLNFGRSSFPFSPQSLLTIAGYLPLSLLQHFQT
jgi:hypothetical protein